MCHKEKIGILQSPFPDSCLSRQQTSEDVNFVSAPSRNGEEILIVPGHHSIIHHVKLSVMLWGNSQNFHISQLSRGDRDMLHKRDFPAVPNNSRTGNKNFEEIASNGRAFLL